MNQPAVPAEASKKSDQKLIETADLLGKAHKALMKQMSKVIVGQTDVIDLMLLALFCRGHCMLEGAPGLAKTLMISTMAKALSLDFGRIQFTPDLMPSDITGTEILEEDQATGHRHMRFVKGPIFANIILADEINRTPPKTQAALLQAMQEHVVTVAGESYELTPPFLVLGTQNPIENEGTYPLPEAQLDRFMFKVFVDYPSLEDEIEIAIGTTGKAKEEIKPVLTVEHIVKLQAVVRQVLVARPVASYAVQMVRATRPKDDKAPEYVKKYLTWGAGPRACQAMLLGAKAHALLDGRTHVSMDDIRFIAKPVLRHRLVTNFTAEAENISVDDVIDELVSHLPEDV